MILLTNNKLKFAIMPTVSFLCLLMLAPVAMQVQAVTPFDTDHDHECSDAKLSDSTDKYTSQPKSLEFMDGYKAGYDACSNKDSDIDGSSESQSIRQPQFSNQNGR